jgi:glycosyltransferase involved in cell wall biosynthesis
LTAIVAATPSIAQRFAQHRQVVVIQNYPEVESFPLAMLETRSPRLGHFVYVGGLSVGRGIREIVSAVGRVGPPATLSLAGPWERPELPEFLRGQKEWGAVRECGFLPRKDVFALLGSSQAGLVVLQPLANHVESLPVKMFEYMLSGLPVIASDFPLWRQILGDAHCGILVDPMSVDDIARAMQRIIDTPEESRAMGLRGRAAVLSSYNWEAESAKLLLLYDSVGN